MKILAVLTFSILVYLIYGFYISQIDLTVINPKLRDNINSIYYDYKGIINVHTDQSLGSSSALQIIKSARNAKLDFMIFTDLNNFNETNLIEGYFEETLIMSGAKISYLDSRFIVIPFTKGQLGANLGDAQVRLADLLSQPKTKDYLIILAHPFNSGFNWNGPLPQGIDGFEIVNLKSLAQKAFQVSSVSPIWSLFIYPFNSALSFTRLFNEPTDELNLFDSATSQTPVSGFAGAEASARAIPTSNVLIKFPSYQKTFEIFANHVWVKSELTGNLKTDKNKILGALKQGNFYIAFDMIGDPKGFVATIEDRGKFYLPGTSMKLNRHLKLRVSLPESPKFFFEIVIYRNGDRYQTFNQKNIDLEISQPGTYRIQVRVSPYFPLPDATKWITWIYTNAFFITP